VGGTGSDAPDAADDMRFFKEAGAEAEAEAEAEETEGGAGGTTEASALPRSMEGLDTDRRIAALALAMDGRGEALVDSNAAPPALLSGVAALVPAPAKDDSQPNTPPNEGVLGLELGTALLERCGERVMIDRRTCVRGTGEGGGEGIL
jgi:hypothetical protein